MRVKDMSFAPLNDKFSMNDPKAFWVIMITLFIAALGLRVYRINDPAFDFHPTRQYHSANIARSFLFESSPQIPDWEKNIAEINRKDEHLLEPPIMEYFAFLMYRVVDMEMLWIPKLLSAILWLIGGVVLYKLAKDLLSSTAGIFSVAFYLFVPFSIPMSRSFQPESLMILAYIVSIYAIWRYHKKPSRLKLIEAAIFSAFALFIKPVCVFVLFASFLGTSISRQGIRKTLATVDLYLFGLISSLPAAIFYLFFSEVLQTNPGQTFVPSLLFSPTFWSWWLNQLDAVIGNIWLVGALIGLLILDEGQSKRFVISLWVGYVIFGLVFTRHIHTHDYYSVQLIPIAALSIAPIGSLIFGRLTQSLRNRFWRLTVIGIFLFSMLLYFRAERRRIDDSFYTDQSLIGAASEIGIKTNHSDSTIFLAPYYGKPLEYYGEISGKSWPTFDDFYLETIQGKKILTAQERLDSMIHQFSPEYFIVTDLNEFESQQDLKQYLTSEFQIIAQNQYYYIYKLRK